MTEAYKSETFGIKSSNQVEFPDLNQSKAMKIDDIVAGPKNIQYAIWHDLALH